jgi:hypothetical protein
MMKPGHPTRRGRPARSTGPAAAGGIDPSRGLALRVLDDRRDKASRETLRRRIRSEFDELHGLCLTLPQAQRLFDLPADVCVRVLNELILWGVLVIGKDGLYRRAEGDG